MADFEYIIKNDPLYIAGTRIGFLAGLFIFSSVFYFIMSKIGTIPSSIRYKHMLLFVAVIYVAWFIYRLFKK